MSKYVLAIMSLLALSTCAAFSSVTVSSPTNGGTESTSVLFVASATTTCSKGIASMGVYTAPGVLAYVVNGANLSTTLKLTPGTYNTEVQEWDYCGGATKTPITITVSAQAAVNVTSPANNSTVSSLVNFSATGTTPCATGVAAMGIYSAPFQLAYVTKGATLKYALPMSPGKYNAVVEEWDNCGGASTTPVTITVGGNAFSNLQQSVGWSGYGQVAPDFVDCSPSPCDGIAWSLTQGIKSPALSGAASQYSLGGTTPYGDALWNNHLIGDLSSQNLADTNHTLVPTLHNFTYDVYFYGANLELAEALEFDVNQFFDNLGFIWGHECRIAGGHEWDIWDNVNQQWIPTGITCTPIDNSWNHLTIQVERTSNNQLLYQSITLNGVTSTVNQTYSAGLAPGWWGITVNYQMDGNVIQAPYAVLLDQLAFSYE